MSVFPIKTLENGGLQAKSVLFTATEWLHSKQGLNGEHIPRRLTEHFMYLLQHFCCWTLMWVKTTLKIKDLQGTCEQEKADECERYQITMNWNVFPIRSSSVLCHGQLQIRATAQFLLPVKWKRYSACCVCETEFWSALSPLFLELSELQL